MVQSRSGFSPALKSVMCCNSHNIQHKNQLQNLGFCPGVSSLVADPGVDTECHTPDIGHHNTFSNNILLVLVPPL